MTLDDHHKAWLLWNYSENVQWDHQVTITQWAWAEFTAQLGTKKIAGKTLERLKALIWLAAQDTKAALSGKDRYQHAGLSALVGVKPDNWTHNYRDYWRAMVTIFEHCDRDALLMASRSRSQQKLAFSQPDIAKVN